MKWKFIVVLIFIGLLHFVVAKSKNSGRKGFKKAIRDHIAQARCDIVCKDITAKKVRVKCIRDCMVDQVKLGTCPKPVLTKWTAACVDACNSDIQCNGTEKCCTDSCGHSCKEPLDILTVPGLPELPVIKQVKERKGRSRGITISWSSGVGDKARTVPGKILYIVEEQHHSGPNYDAEQLGDWIFLKRTKRNKIHLESRLKRGYWYRFRVASVSESGSRGYSNPSEPFSPRVGPNRPPKPKNLKVVPLIIENGTETIRVEWKGNMDEDLPVKKYKVFWSRRVRGVGGELDSVLVNYQSVPPEQNYYVIRHLEPNSTYFIQVQAVSEFGFNRLKSEKEAVFYNTSIAKSKSDEETISERSRFHMWDDQTLQSRAPGKGVQPTEKSRFQMPDHVTPVEKKEEDILQTIKGIKLDNIKLVGTEIKAQISWDPAINGYYFPERYYIHWSVIKCKVDKSANGPFVDTTNETWFEIYDLDFDCSYRISVNQSLKPKSTDPYILITVPCCHYFQTRSATKIDC